MLRKKMHTLSGTFAERVRRISESAPSFEAKAPATGAQRARRAPAYRPGTLTLMGGERIDVVVTNLSNAGARIQFKRGTPLPERVRLSEPRTGKDKWAYVMWQGDRVAGLQFVGAKAAQAR